MDTPETTVAPRSAPLEDIASTARAALASLNLPSPLAFALYTATLAAEIPTLLARMLLLVLAGVAVSLLKGEALSAHEAWGNYAVLVFAWSASALLVPLAAGMWWQNKLGGRRPSNREQQAYRDALDLITDGGKLEVKQPSHWFVVDSPVPDAAVCGETLMLTRAMFEVEQMPAVLAHELGHLNSSDGKLTAALNRLVINPRIKERESYGLLRGDAKRESALHVTLIGALLWLGKRLLVLAQGGLGLRLLVPAWGGYWRGREYIADDFAKLLGQGEDLADFLEMHAQVHDGPVPFIWLTDHTHPPTELRIERLRRPEGEEGRS